MSYVKCGECGEPARIDFQLPKCVNRRCKYYDKNVWVEWVMSLPDDGDPLEDEDTQPQWQPYKQCPKCGFANLWCFCSAFAD